MIYKGLCEMDKLYELFIKNLDKIQPVVLSLILMSFLLILVGFFSMDYLDGKFIFSGREEKEYLALLVGLLLLVIAITIYLYETKGDKVRLKEIIKTKDSLLSSETNRSDSEILNISEQEKFREKLHESKWSTVMLEILRNLNQSMKIDNKEFRYSLAKKLNHFYIESEDWVAGKIVTEFQEEVHSVPQKIYESANQAMFTTSLPGYNPQWLKPFGKKLLQSQRGLNIEIERVFIFRDRASVTINDFEAMVTNQKIENIRVSVCFLEDSDNLKELDGNYLDFAIINNGEVIGYADSFAGKVNETWLFKPTQAKLGRYLQLASMFADNSSRFTDISEKLREIVYSQKK